MSLGDTKLVRLSKIEKLYEVDCELYAKVENTNPTGSIKDRTAYNMLLEYKNDGTLKDNGTVIEATSGNTGISLAYFSKTFNYRCIIVMPESASLERRTIIKSYGAELILVKGGMKECNDKVTSLLKEIPDSFRFSQFDSPYNPLAHYKTTGPEIHKDLEDVDYVFAGAGTGGTVSGIGKYFKEVKHETKIIGIEPEESPLITKGIAAPHLIQGIGANFVPDTLLKEYVDEFITVKGQEAINTAKKIREAEELDIGISSGAALLGAINYVRTNKLTGKKIVVIFPDKGDRYAW